MEELDEHMLEMIADLKGMMAGACNIRKNGELLERSEDANVSIVTKDGRPGIDITVKAGTKGETVHIPVIITKEGVEETVYNTFYIGDDCDITIMAGCGIHNPGHAKSEHNGVHDFHVGKNSHIRYIEKHYGEGEGTGERILNPVTELYAEEGAFIEMETTQLRGVDSTLRETNAVMGKDSKLILTERLLTHDRQHATSNLNIKLEGEGSSVQIISRSVAQDDSVQVFNPLVIGETQCRGHVQCDAIIMGNAVVKAIPGIEARSDDALLVHEAAIGKIAGDQIIKLQTLGLSEEEAEAQILEDFLS